MIAAAYTMNRIGFPQRFSMVMAETVERRARNRTIGLALQSGLQIITYPMSNGDWAVRPVYDDTTEAPSNLPVAVHLLDADRLIDQVTAQLRAIVAGDDVPDFTIPDPEPEPNPFSPKSNFFRAWEKDAQGRWVFVGLNWQETQDLLDHRDSRLVGDDLEIIDRPEGYGRRNLDEEREAYLDDLSERHEAARLRACGLAMNDDEPGDQ